MSQDRPSTFDLKSMLPISPGTGPADGSIEFVGLIRPAQDRPDQLTPDEINRLNSAEPAL